MKFITESSKESSAESAQNSHTKHTNRAHLILHKILHRIYTKSLQNPPHRIRAEFYTKATQNPAPNPHRVQEPSRTKGHGGGNVTRARKTLVDSASLFCTSKEVKRPFFYLYPFFLYVVGFQFFAPIMSVL